MRFLKGGQDGYGAASLLVIVSIVAAGGIYLHNLESKRALSLTEKQKIRSQADLDLYSSLAVARSLFELDESGDTPVIYVDPFFIDSKNPLYSRIKVSPSGNSQSSQKSLFEISGLNLRQLNITVKRPEINTLNEKDWYDISTGKVPQHDARSVFVTLDSVDTKEAKLGSGKFYIDTVRLKASLRDAGGSEFEKKAEFALPRPAKPNCETIIDVNRIVSGLPTSTQQVNGPFNRPVWIALFCNSVISNVEVSGNISKLCKVVEQPWKDPGFKNSFDADRRGIFQARCDKEGIYNREDIEVTGVDPDSEAVGRDFQIVGSGSPSPSCKPGSKSVNGFCFYMGGNQQSCNSVCKSKGLSYNGQGTSWANSKTNCLKVMKQFGKSGYKSKANNGAGCKYFKGLNKGIYTTYVARASSIGIYGDHRVCACK